MSTPTFDSKKSSITVKIYLPDDRENVLAVNFSNYTRIEELKDEIAKKFKVRYEMLVSKLMTARQIERDF